MNESEIPKGFPKPKEDPWGVYKIMAALLGSVLLAWLAYNYVYLPSSGG